MTFQIREATLDDCRGISVVHVECWRSTYRGIVPDALLDDLSVEKRTEQRRKQLTERDRGQFCYVAEVDSQIVAFAVGGIEREGNPDYPAELYAIYVLEEHQARGIGSSLVGVVVDRFLSDSKDSMLVWVMEENPWRRFYEKLGGVYVKSKRTKIPGVQVRKVAYGWTDLRILRSKV